MINIYLTEKQCQLIMSSIKFLYDDFEHAAKNYNIDYSDTLKDLDYCYEYIKSYYIDLINNI